MIQLILRFSWRNIWRNRRRSLLTLSAIVIGMIALIFGRGYINGTIAAMVEPTLRLHSGHIRLAHPEYLRLERTLPKERLIQPLSTVMSELSSLSGITGHQAMLKFHGLAVHDQLNEAVLMMGIDAAQDSRSMRLTEFIRKGTFLTENPNSLVIGRKLAKELAVDVGDELLLITSDINYSTYALPFSVSGIIEIGVSGIDRSGIIIHAHRAAEMLAVDDAAHEIFLFLDDRNQAPQLASALSKSLAGSVSEIRVIPWQDNEFIVEMMPLIRKVWGSILAMLMFLVALVILNTMLMTVMERYREIGILKALGLRNRDVVAMIFCEAAYLGGIGSLIGGFLGTLLTSIVSRTGIDISQAMNSEMFDKADIPMSFIGSSLHPIVTPLMVLSAVLFGIVTALVAVVYPALKSRRMSPVEAFRTELKV